MDELKNLYENYLEQVHAAAAAMRPGDGLFGMGKKLSDDPCHDIFIGNLRYFILKKEQSSPEEIHRALTFIYHAPAAFPDADTSAYWLMAAAQGLTLPLIPRLRSEDAADLALWYEAAYPPGDRLPAQKKVLQALRACGQIPQADRWFSKR